MRRVYITGNKGFIAGHIAKNLGMANYFVYGADLPSTDYRVNRTALAEFRYWMPDLVIHNAAQVGRVFGEDNIAYTIEENATMSANVAIACAELGIRLLYISTSEVYGDQGDNACYEGGQTVVPHNLYGLSKRWGEEASVLYAAKTGLQIVRLSMPFGEGLPAGRGRAAIINFMYNAIHGMPIPVHKDSERSWCYVGDTVEGIRYVIERGDIMYEANEYEQGVGTYNIGRFDNPVSMRYVAELACDIAGASHDLIQMVDAPPNQTKVKRLTNEKLVNLGWEPQIDLKQGMEIIYEYVKTLKAND